MPANPEEKTETILGKKIAIKPIYNAKCKVCKSINRDMYEKMFMDSHCSPEWTFYSKQAKETFQESISYNSFARHFKNHFDMPIAKYFEKKGKVEAEVVKTKSETVNTLREIKDNLSGLKFLLTKAKGLQNVTPQTLSAIAAIYREHRLTLESCEKLSRNLSATSDISKAEIIREIFYSAQHLCSDCKKKFLGDLDERLKNRNV